MANGLFGGGDGSEFSPFLVEDAVDLNKVRDYVGQKIYFKQTATIDLASIANWIPIGTGADIPFVGYFDGGDFNIKNMNCQHSNDYIGLFGAVVGNGGLQNIHLIDSKVSGGSYTGALVGHTDNITITNCSVVGGELSGRSYSGGLIGGLFDSHVSMICSDSIMDSGGGLIGGVDNSIINDCYALGSIIEGGSCLIGQIASSLVTNVYAAVDTDEDWNGRLIKEFYMDSDNLINSFYDSEKTGWSVENQGARTTNELMRRDTFTDWDFDNVWMINEGKSYPFFKKKSIKCRVMSMPL